ncbi:DUF480 domain-containing protein [Nocardioides marmoribigeumensis]|uniref:Uncharacterized protein YceH (UPF0502 family)/protein-L-isoaspartate O-methyltransferase n=1 Tax=Nocardioides marmoribigeumensis TaxID=433649 RepID=A0ABU2C169_9ACTN|nr:DUF480 domain-containing protein [Nocardioides marmoribigeumensis]MDR7364390.1 uncharacterized protein YceH (UPF0502 family)/protein-L-isoaspartate O-methyltransferase [Nocardioides marmoribigeumensis]
MSLPVLTPEEQRVVGSLLEKERTVPASYPLSANALRTACNQTSSREPVTDYDERFVETTARALKDRGLVRIVWSDTGRRTLKYLQTLTEVLDLGDDERAVLTVMLLRGPQAPGELRTRTERLHAFADRGEVETTLAAMAAREDPLVRQLARRPGERDARWVHLLGEAPPQASSEPPAATAPVEVDLGTRDERVRASYAAVAATYADRFTDELDALPFERWLLDRVAADAMAAGLPVVEAGTGPGHVAAHLADQGATATGIDLSPAMVEQAAARFPQASYAVGDLRSLMRPRAAAGWGAVVAWYSLIHLTPGELPAALQALVRPLAPGGQLVLAFHAGTGVVHLDRWFDQDVDLDVVLHEPRAVARALEAAGLTEVTWHLRGPVAGRGESTERAFVLGRRPA